MIFCRNRNTPEVLIYFMICFRWIYSTPHHQPPGDDDYDPVLCCDTLIEHHWRHTPEIIDNMPTSRENPAAHFGNPFQAADESTSFEEVRWGCSSLHSPL